METTSLRRGGPASSSDSRSPGPKSRGRVRSRYSDVWPFEARETRRHSGPLTQLPKRELLGPFRPNWLTLRPIPQGDTHSSTSQYSSTKGFESECLYERLGALIIKRYVPTGGGLVMRRLRRHHPERRWVRSNLQSLRNYEKRTRLNESVHLIGFVAFGYLAVSRFASGSITAVALAAALVSDVILGLWPIVLQRYNRLRLYRAINRLS